MERSLSFAAKRNQEETREARRFRDNTDFTAQISDDEDKSRDMVSPWHSRKVEHWLSQSEEERSANYDLQQNLRDADESVVAPPITPNKEQLPIDWNMNPMTPQRQQLLPGTHPTKPSLNPFLNLSSQEESAYAYLFSLVDVDRRNMISGEQARRVLRENGCA
jgi:hypothetical protein